MLQTVRQSPPDRLHSAALELSAVSAVLHRVNLTCWDSVVQNLNPKPKPWTCCAGYEHEDHAAEAHDVAALRCKGTKAKTNFPESRRAALRAWLRLNPQPCTQPVKGPALHKHVSEHCQTQQTLDLAAELWQAGQDGTHQFCSCTPEHQHSY